MSCLQLTKNPHCVSQSKRFSFCFSRSGFQDPSAAPEDVVAAIIAQTAPDVDARKFAAKILDSLRRRKLGNVVDNASMSAAMNGTTLSDLLPSFLSETVVTTPSSAVSFAVQASPSISISETVNEASFSDVRVIPDVVSDSSEKENFAPPSSSRRSSRSFLRHSSPIKARRSPLAVITDGDDKMSTSASKAKRQLSSQLKPSDNVSVTRMAFPQQSSGAAVSAARLVSNSHAQSLVFPVECNRVSVLWVSTKVESQSEQLMVRNIHSDRSVLVSARIQDSEEFSFANETQSLELSFEPGETKTVPVSYVPKLSSVGQWVRGKLVLMPRGLRAGNKRLKASIPLQARNELLRVSFQSDKLTFKTHASSELKLSPESFAAGISVSNSGSGAAFVCFSAEDGRNLARPEKFVLNSGQSQLVQVSAQASDQQPASGRLGKVFVTSGSEIGRAILRKSEKFGGKFEFRDFAATFPGEDESNLIGCDVKVLTPENLLPVLNSFERFEMDVLLDRGERPHPDGDVFSRPTQFYTLLTEETFATNASYRLSGVYQDQQHRHQVLVRSGEIELAFPEPQSGPVQVLRGGKGDFSVLEATKDR